MKTPLLYFIRNCCKTTAATVVLAFASHAAIAQECGTPDPAPGGQLTFTGPNADCGHQSTIFNSFFSKNVNFRPYSDSNIITTTPKEIKVRAIVVTNTNYPNPSNPNPNYTTSAADKERIRTITEYWANEVPGRSLSSLTMPDKPKPDVCGTCYIQDSKFRLKLTGIEYVTAAFDTNHSQSVSYHLDHFGSESDSVLNIFFVNYIYSSHPSVNGVTGSQPNAYDFNSNKNGIIMYRTYELNDTVGSGFNDWYNYPVVIHEIGHAFGFGHLYSSTMECNPPNPDDYLYDILGANRATNICPLGFVAYGCPHTDPNTLCTNNFMDQKDGYFSPIQLGRMHRESYIGGIAKYIYPTESPDLHPMEIASDQTWDFGIRMYQNIIVKTGKTLTIKCEVQMPPGSKIIVEKGAKLLIDGGNITAYHPKATWKGVELFGDKNLAPLAANQGSLVMTNEAMIEYAEIGVKDYQDNIWQGGGIIQADHSTFKDCHKAVGLNDYPNYSRGNSCSFQYVHFLSENKDALTNIATTGIGMFTAYNEKGIIISNCNFDNNISFSDKAMAGRSMAIYAEDAGLTAKDCTFSKYLYGVYPSTYSNTPLRSVYVLNSEFDSMATAICFSDNFSFADSNIIKNSVGYPFTSGIMSYYRLGTGIEADNAGALTITRNTIQNDPATAAMGIMVNDTRNYGGRIISNNINGAMVALQTQKDNPHLDMLCNTFSNNDHALSINPQSSGSAYHLKDQGNGCGNFDYRAGNKFYNNGRDIVSWLTNPWNYYYWAPDPAQVPYNTSGNIITTGCGLGTNDSDPNIQCDLNVSVMTNVNDNFNEAVITWPVQTTTWQNSPEGMLQLSYIVSRFNKNNDKVGLTTFLESINTLTARKYLLPIYLENEDYTQFAATLAAMNDLPAGEYNGYTTYYNILKSLRGRNRQLWQLSSVQFNTISNLAEDSLEVSALARSLLEFAYQMPWHHYQEQIGSAPLYKTMPLEDVSQQSRLYDAAPNPAADRTTIKVYITASDAGLKPLLLLRNEAGKPVQQFVLSENENNITVSTAALSAGIYYYSLLLGGKVVDTKKLIIIK